MISLVSLDKSAPMTMSTREIAELLGKAHSNIKISAERMQATGVIGTLAVQEFEHNGNTYTEYLLEKRDSLILVAQNSPEYTARIVDRWQELESSTAKAIALPDFSDPVAAARAWADAKEGEQKAIALAEDAIRTKALIGSKREASAMATASAKSKEVSRLQIELDKSSEYATVKRMEMAYHGQRFNWRLLKSASQDLGIPAREVFDANYGTVKSYHADAWREAYALEII